MAPKGDPQLSEVGTEAFGLLEEILPSRYPPPQGPRQRQFQQEEAVLNNFEAAKKYGGMAFADPRKRKPVPVRKVYYYEVV
uniref:Uncharacterized protein n=1 Tax=Vitis vinifera TaxID=29760 RepID=F6H6X7_VITVI